MTAALSSYRRLLRTLKSRSNDFSNSVQLFTKLKDMFRTQRNAESIRVVDQYLKQMIHVDEHRELLKRSGYLRSEDISELERVRVNAARVGLGLPHLYGVDGDVATTKR
ncbi:mitochondrial Complex1_LYR_2 family protein [Andalucia godoyi]|uniref:Mitochondrial Complex1_LYR_2 family protein n=1 Tax=Andalucia godoyi TaxID=505711 RepID=A0A8K0AK04_ANDGO|nr:mitochondrial Complex1_LYR_2 family protein [Andalucia godoyi]|eukprot:ANDGO_00666.mRNA.1 mitochondrial Complex1_LYR_2 family protein